MTIYYGTTDGGTNPAAWANSVAIGTQSGSFSTNVSGLNQSTTYYFTATATNSVGAAWATPSQTFTTGSVTPPVMTTRPPRMSRPLPRASADRWF